MAHGVNGASVSAASVNGASVDGKTVNAASRLSPSAQTVSAAGVDVLRS
jgi:hypothetical protein